MTEETKEQQVIQINTKEIVKNLIEAGKLALVATRYDHSNPNKKKIFINDESEMVTNTTLSEYIRRAEKEFVAKMSNEIIIYAGGMIADEINQLKELLK